MIVRGSGGETEVKRGVFAIMWVCRCVDGLRNTLMGMACSDPCMSMVQTACGHTSTRERTTLMALSVYNRRPHHFVFFSCVPNRPLATTPAHA